MFFLKSTVFLRKKSPRQGCTTQKTELGMHQNQSIMGMLKFISNLVQIYFKLTLDLHGSIFRNSSEHLNDMGLGCARVPKITPNASPRGSKGAIFI